MHHVRIGIKPLLICAMSFFASSAYAACIPTKEKVCLADQPIQGSEVIKPNIMFVLDNSGSMAWDYMPDNANTGGNCRRNYQYNTLYYNPNFDYTKAVPKDAAGNSMGSQTWPNAEVDPFTSTATVKLSTNFKAYGGDTPQAAYYYKYNGTLTPGQSPCPSSGWTKVVVGSNSCVVSGDVKSCPSADERTNFANWYSYFRTRINMMKSAMATAFAAIDGNYRVGFHTINSPGSTLSNGGSLDVKEFADTPAGDNKSDWYAMLFKQKPAGSTPLQDALNRVGKYYQGSPPANSGLKSDPLQYSCQKNYAILSTDGYWNSNVSFLPAGNNWDTKVPSSMPANETGDSAKPHDPQETGLTAGQNFPGPYYDSSSTGGTLADVAMKYWVTDLRTSGPYSKNNVKASKSDPAYWQHMGTYTIGLGLDGQLAFTEANLDKLTAKTINWPKPVENTLTTIDDLWHAAVNGRGQYYKANDAASLSSALINALRAITSEPTYGVGPTSSTNDFKSPGQDDFTTYAISYSVRDWSGDVAKYAVDRTTGQKSGAALWSASAKLDARVTKDGYQSRIIVTRNSDTKQVVPFLYSSLSDAQKTALCYTTGSGTCDDSLVNWIRGDATYEGDYGVSGTRFRNRVDDSETKFVKRNLLGAAINAKPAYVAVESRNYQDASDPGYSDFLKQTKTRKPVLYVPANDGMVHALDAETGEELWAYIPSFLISQAKDDITNKVDVGLRALSYQWGGVPPYVQHYYVDATPELAAVDFKRANKTKVERDAIDPKESEWRNILVGGLGKGGRGYYALDVTSPAATLAAAKSAVLWEFPNENTPESVKKKIGYTYGSPIIAKTGAYGWVVIVPSGYNSESDIGHLFVLDPKSGALLATLDTPGNAPGLTYITFLASTVNKYVNQIYAGDVLGNVWRFDSSNQDASKWKDATVKIFTSPAASPASSSPAEMPITSEVTVGIDGNTGDRWVFFGTGQYLSVNDRTTKYAEYLVGLKDGKIAKPDEWSSPASLSSLTSVSNLASGIAGGCAEKGWKFALDKSAGERVVVKPVADLRTVIFISMKPVTDDPCKPAVNSVVYGLDYCSARSRLTEGNAIIASKPMTGAVTGSAIQMPRQSAASSGVPQATLCSSTGQCASIQLDAGKISNSTRHVGWREVMDEY